MYRNLRFFIGTAWLAGCSHAPLPPSPAVQSPTAPDSLGSLPTIRALHAEYEHRVEALQRDADSLARQKDERAQALEQVRRDAARESQRLAHERETEEQRRQEAETVRRSLEQQVATFQQQLQEVQHGDEEARARTVDARLSPLTGETEVWRTEITIDQNRLERVVQQGKAALDLTKVVDDLQFGVTAYPYNERGYLSGLSVSYGTHPAGRLNTVGLSGPYRLAAGNSYAWTTVSSGQQYRSVLAIADVSVYERTNPPQEPLIKSLRLHFAVYRQYQDVTRR